MLLAPSQTCVHQVLQQIQIAPAFASCYAPFPFLGDKGWHKEPCAYSGCNSGFEKVLACAEGKAVPMPIVVQVMALALIQLAVADTNTGWVYTGWSSPEEQDLGCWKIRSSP